MKKTVTISHVELVNLLLNIEQAGGLRNSFFGYKIDTDAIKNDMNKKSRISGAPVPFASVRKLSAGVARLGVDYKKAVENKAERITGEAVEFQPEKMKGRHHYNGSKIIAESDTVPGKFYVIFDARSARSAKSVFVADGVPVARESLAEYMKAKKPGFIPWRTVTVSNIKEAKINGTRYVVAN